MLTLASTTLPKIASVTGHSVQSVHDALKHDLARHPEMAEMPSRSRWNSMTEAVDEADSNAGARRKDVEDKLDGSDGRPSA